MKTFTTSGTGSQQTLSEIETDKIPVYDSVTDAEADLVNLAENQIIATHDTGSELSAPVDVVQSGNMHAVTSNAVAEALNGLSGFKFYCVGENGASVSVSKGIFFYGNGTNYFCRIFTESATVYPTNDYWGEPASGYNKIMIGFYKP